MFAIYLLTVIVQSEQQYKLFLGRDGSVPGFLSFSLIACYDYTELKEQQPVALWKSMFELKLRLCLVDPYAGQ